MNNNAIFEYLMQKIDVKLLLEIFVIYFLVIWILVLFWVYDDISYRTDSLFYKFFSILIILIFTPLFWFFIYLIIRPKRTLFDKFYEEVDYNLDILKQEIYENISKKNNTNKN